MESAGLICKVDMTAGMKCGKNLHLGLWCTCHLNILTYTGCHRRNGPNSGRVFLMLNYTDITQNTYVPSLTAIEIMAK